MRSQAVLSMMPGMVTLVKLEQVGGGGGLMMSGRVLLQNGPSVGYWGHLDQLSDTGVLWMWVGSGWVWTGGVGISLQTHMHAHPRGLFTRDPQPLGPRHPAEALPPLPPTHAQP